MVRGRQLSWWTPESGGKLNEIKINAGRPTRMPNLPCGTLEYIGSFNGYSSHPKGLQPREELLEMFADYDLTAYQSPAYGPDVNLAIFRRYGSDTLGSVHVQTLDKAARMMTQMFAPFISAPVASHEEVMLRMESSKSPGVPYKFSLPTKGAWFENYGNQWLDRAYEHFVNVEPWQGLLFHFEKEEIRKKNKLPHGILACPLDMQYIAMRLFLNQNDGLHSSALRHWSAVGISRDGLDWHRLYRRLKRFDRGACADVKEMDAHILSVVMQRVRDMRKRCLLGATANELKAVDELYSQLLDSVCLVNNEVWQKQNGLPTGWFCTSDDNTYAMILYFLYAILIAYPDWTLSQITTAFEAVFYGDDDSYSYDEAYPLLAPEALIPTISGDFGLEVTTNGLQRVEEFDFLSAFFKPVLVGDVQVMVPLFNQTRLLSHVVFGPKNTHYEEFQRIASIRQVAIWDDSVLPILDRWLLDHRHWVSAAEFAAFVPAREVVRAAYLVPKQREVYAIEEALNGPASLRFSPPKPTNNRSEFFHFSHKQTETGIAVTQMSRGSYTKNILSRLENQGTLTPAGANYLKMALDPFPDQEHPVVGMPDGASGRSYVQSYNQTITVTKPPGLAAGALWDLNLVFIPELIDPALNNKLSSVASFQGTILTASGGTFQTGVTATAGQQFNWRAPLMAIAVPTGLNTLPYGGTTPPPVATTGISGFDLSGYVGPQTRVIGGGFEAINTTPELYRGGSVVYYTQACEQRASSTPIIDYSTGSATPQWGQSSRVMRAPPSTVAQAISIPGSVKRGAEEGCYIVLRQTKGESNPPRDPEGERIVWLNSSQISVTAPALGGFTEGNPNVIVVAAYPPMSLLGVHQGIPFDVSGAFFTGLNENSSIDVTLRLFIEGFPTPVASQQLVSLTVPCPPMDETAIELYSKICAELPPGVPIIENENGGWWKSLMQTVASVAPTLGAALGSVVPGGGLIGNGVGKVAEMLGNIKLNDNAQARVDKEKAAIKERAGKSPMYRMALKSPQAGVKAGKRGPRKRKGKGPAVAAAQAAGAN